MILDFDKIEETAIPNMKGGDGTVLVHRHVDDAGVIMRVVINPGCSIGKHVHNGNYEVAYVLSGHGINTADGIEEPVEPGQAVYCPTGKGHTLRCAGNEPLVLLAVIPNVK